MKIFKVKTKFLKKNNQSMNILLFGIKWVLYKTAPPLDYVICELWFFGLITRVEQGDLEDAFNSLSWLLRGSICNTLEHSWRSGVLDAKGATNDPGPTLRWISWRSTAFARHSSINLSILAIPSHSTTPFGPEWGVPTLKLETTKDACINWSVFLYYKLSINT